MGDEPHEQRYKEYRKMAERMRMHELFAESRTKRGAPDTRTTASTAAPAVLDVPPSSAAAPAPPSASATATHTAQAAVHKKPKLGSPVDAPAGSDAGEKTDLDRTPQKQQYVGLLGKTRTTTTATTTPPTPDDEEQRRRRRHDQERHMFMTEMMMMMADDDRDSDGRRAMMEAAMRKNGASFGKDADDVEEEMPLETKRPNTRGFLPIARPPADKMAAEKAAAAARASSASTTDEEKKAKVARRRHDDRESVMAMHYMMSSRRHHRWSPPPKKHWQLVEERFRESIWKKKPDVLKESLDEWEALKDKPGETQFKLAHHLESLYTSKEGSLGLVKILHERVGLEFYRPRDITREYSNLLCQLLSPRHELGVVSGRGGMSSGNEVRAERAVVRIRGALLYDAVTSMRTEFVREMLDCGADLRTPSPLTTSYLHLTITPLAVDGSGYGGGRVAADRVGKFRRMVDLLLASGVEVDAQDERGLTPLHVTLLLCVERLNGQASDLSFMADVAEKLVRCGADPLKARGEGRLRVCPFPRFDSPLHAAVELGRREFIEIATHTRPRVPAMPPPAPRLPCPDLGADDERAVQERLRAPTMVAASNQHLEVVERLMIMQVDDVEVQANALELLGARMAVSRMRTIERDERRLSHQHVRRETDAVHTLVHFLRRAARLRARHGLRAKVPAVRGGVLLARGPVREPTTEREILALGLSEFDDMQTEANRERKGVMHAVGFLVQERLFAVHNHYAMFHPNRAVKRAVENLSCGDAQDFLGCMDLCMRLGALWRRPLVPRFNSYEFVYKTAAAMRKVMESRPMSRECVVVLPPLLEWLTLALDMCHLSGGAQGVIMNAGNRMLCSAAVAWPAMFHDGKLDDLSNYVDEMFMRYCTRCNRCKTTPLIVVIDRSTYGPSGRHYHRRDRYVREFGEDVLALTRLWAANGVEHRKANSSGKTAMSILRKDIASMREFHSIHEKETVVNQKVAWELVAFVEPEVEKDSDEERVGLGIWNRRGM